MRRGGARGGKDLIFAGFGTPIENVLIGRAIEHRGFLAHDRDLPPQSLLRKITNVGAV